VALKKRRLGEILIAQDVIAPDGADAAEEYADKQGIRIGEALVKLGLCEESDVVDALSQQTLRPTLSSIPLDSVDLELYSQLPISFVKTHQVLPLWIDEDDDTVAVAIADPFAMSPVDDLRVLLDRPVTPWIAAPTVIKESTNRIYDQLARSAGQVIEELEDEKTEEDHLLEEIEDIVDSDDDAPIIRFVNSLLTEALKERVSDIHFEPFERTMQVRFRIDGILYNKVEAPKRLQAAISSRVKVMAQLDIAEKRLPQDGRIRIKVAGRDVDIRVSTVPVAHGERIVLRLQDRSAGLLSLDQIGIEGPKLPNWREHIRRPHGILLVTGPTGSGKTTTLYASISEINRPDINILTVEDPVEYQMKGIGQMAVNPKIDLTFARGLRAYLRQDPDVILVGEIRDLETAEIAIQASLTGHLVLSTLHTNDAATAVNRLVDMGVEPFLVASSLTAVMAQRLLRRLCPDCKVPYDPDPASMIELGIDPEEARKATTFRPKEGGCESCLGTGYRGRTGIYELLTINDKIRSQVVQNLSSSVIRQSGIDGGMTTLRADGASKFLQGLTSMEEVVRITQDDANIMEDASVA